MKMNFFMENLWELFDIGSKVSHISHDYCQENGIQIYPISQFVNIEGTGGDILYCYGYIEAKLSLPVGNKMLDINAPLLDLPSTEYHNRIPIPIGTSITNLIIDSVDASDMPHNHGKWFAILHKPESKCSHSNSKEGLWRLINLCHFNLFHYICAWFHKNERT